MQHARDIFLSFFYVLYFLSIFKLVEALCPDSN
jgi:hypothetical protein